MTGTKVRGWVVAAALCAVGCDGGAALDAGGDPGGGFDFAYDYDPGFDADLSGAALDPGGGPPDEVGRWDEAEHPFDRDRHVRPPGGPYGRGDGSSWTDALAGLPATLERGTRYLLASGDYDPGTAPRRVFDPPEAGEAYVGLVKATADDHGVDTGWEPAFADGPAELGPLVVETGYLVVDGRTGLGADPAAYGIALRVRDCSVPSDGVVTFPWNAAARNVSLRHLDIRGCGHRPDPTWGSEDAIYSYAAGVTRFVLRNSFVHDSFRGLLFLQNSRDVLVEGTVFARAGLHHEAFTVALRETEEVVLRRNLLVDSYGVFIGLQGTADVRIHGNVLARTLPDWDVWAAIHLTERGRGIRIANNSFTDLAGLNVGVRASPPDLVPDLEVVNNLWAGCRAGQIMLHGEHTHNAFAHNLRPDSGASLDEAIDEPTKQLLAPPLFHDPARGDWRLLAPTAPGRDLGPLFDRDPAGRTRGADGVWDRGAYEVAE